MHRAGWQWLLAVCALWVAGCTCGTPPVESELTVGFAQPVDGQRLALGDDADPETAGFQYEVVAAAADSAGRTVTLSGAKLEVKLPTETDWHEGPAAVLEGPRVRFPGVTLPGRTNVLRVTVEEQGSKRTATSSQTVTVGAETSSVDITGPAEGQVLRESDDVDPATPGYQVRFKLRTSGLAGRQGTLVCGNACGIPTADFTVSPGGTTEVPVTLTEASCEAQVAECYAVVRFGSRDVASPRRSFTLDSVAPRVELSSPVSAVDSTAFKVEAVVGCCEDGTVATLSREGQTPLSATVAAGVISFPEVTAPGEGRFAYTLRVADSGGNPVERPIDVVVASTPYTVSLSAPATVTADMDADGDGTNGIQVDVTATTSASDPATVLEFYTAVTSALGTPARVATTEAAGGGRTATFRVSLAEGNNAVRACVRNPALSDSCQSRTVSVNTGRGSCRIVSPLPGAAVSGAKLPVQVETGLGSVTVRLRDASGTETSATGSASGGGSGVEVDLASDGVYQLVATCETRDGSGSVVASGVSQALIVSRDTVNPELLVAVSSEEGASGVLGPRTRDTSARPGTQVIVSARTEPFAQVTLTGCDPSNNVSGKADASGLALLREVTIPRTGTCSLSVTATDVAGNGTVKQKALTLGLTGAQLSLVAPAAGRALGAMDGTVRTGGGLTVAARVSVSAGSSGLLRLFVGSREVGSVNVEASDSAQEKVFPGVELNEGANVLRTTLTSTTGVAACATALLTVDTATRTLALVLPSRTTTSLNLAADRNVEQPGIQSPLQYALAGAAAGRVDLCTSIPLTTAATPCLDGSGFFTLATNVPSYVANFTFPDGEYALKVVLDDAGFTDTEPQTLVVDSARPRITRLSLENDANGDGQLNRAEQPTGAPVVAVSVLGLEDGRLVQVRDANGVTLLGQASVSGGTARVSLSGLSSPEARYSLVAVVTDKSGNGNKISNPTPLDPLNVEAFTQFRLDRVAPALEVTSPARTVLGPADDADPAEGYQLSLIAVTSGDVGTEGVEVELSPSGVIRKSTPVALKVSELFTVPSSGTTTYTLRLQATDEAKNVTTVTRTVTVDFDPPGLTPVNPTSGAVLDSSIVSLRANVTGAEGRTVNVYSVPKDGSTPALIAALTVGGDGVASGPANLLFGVQDVRFEVSDVAGNLTTATVSDVNVTFVGCDQRFTKPSGTPVTLVRKDDLQPTVAGLQYRIEGVTGVCKGRQVRLFRGSETMPVTTLADATTGAFGFDVTLPDGATTTLRLEMDDGASSTSVSADIVVDITAPTLSNVVPAATTLFYVADSNEALFRTPKPANYLADLSPDGDAEAELSLRVMGALNGSVRVLYKGVDLVKPEVVPDSDDKALVLPITLPHDTTGTLEIVTRDAVGNETRRDATVTVDVRPPAAPTATANVVAGAERTASVAVNWNTVGDDGSSGSPAGYDLRWTTPIVQSGGITTDAIYFSNKVKQANGAVLPSSTTSFTLTPLPPLATYSLQVRARDEVGNYSRIAAPVSVDNFLLSRDVTNPGGGSSFGYLVGAGDLDGAPGADLVVANYDQSSNRGAVYVYSGADLFPSGGGPAVLTQTLQPPDTTLQYFGVDFGIGNAGDAAGEGRADLLVGASGWSSNLGRAFLYLGRAGAGVKGVDPSPIEFRGTVAGGRLGVTARIIGDLNNDGVGEVVLSASYENSGVGRVYLFHGRTRAQWEALRVDTSNNPCTASSSACFIPASKADRIFTGESPAPTDAPNTFGRTRALVSLGDITGDTYGDLLLPASRDTWNRAYLHSGKAVADATSSIPVSAALQVLTQPTGTDRNRFDGFGTEACAGVDLVGGPGLDLVLSHPVTDRLLVYKDGTSTGYAPAATLTIQGSSNFGNGLACTDINGDGRLDLVVGTNPSASGWSVWVLYHQGIAGTEFEKSLGGFNQAQLSGAKSFGVSVAAGDFNADGRPDIAAGANLDPAGARVRIWY